jgi:hypothetical protein
VIRRRPKADPVTPELIIALRERDFGCVLSFLTEDHECRDRWGYAADWRDPLALTVEHVHEGYGMKGKRAPSDLDHCVLLCFGANVGVPSKVERAAMRAYLAARRAA